MVAFLITLALSLTYLAYQWLRNIAVFDIQMKWLAENNPKRNIYSYVFMFFPSKHNYFGLRYPKDENFPLK
jgi:hypothetical protein